MRGRTYLSMILTCLLLVTRAAAAEPSDGRWIMLAETRIGSGLETSSIEVAPAGLAYGRVRLTTTAAELFVQELRLYFADGEMQRVLRDTQLAGRAPSEAYAVDGGPRRIERIEVTFKGRSRSAHRDALVSIWAEGAPLDTAETAAMDDQWLLLGKKLVGANVGHATIAVGRHAGRFESIRLEVQRSDVAFHDIRVIYLDGEVDTLAVRRLIRAGDASPPLALRGQAQFIREIELVQEANPNNPTEAIVQVLARRAMAMR